MGKTDHLNWGVSEHLHFGELLLSPLIQSLLRSFFFNHQGAEEVALGAWPVHSLAGIRAFRTRHS
jgi:hypothetical protein